MDVIFVKLELFIRTDANPNSKQQEILLTNIFP